MSRAAARNADRARSANALALLVVRSRLPGFGYIAAALVLGGLSYGVSVVLDAYALRLVSWIGL